MLSFLYETETLLFTTIPYAVVKNLCFESCKCIFLSVSEAIFRAGFLESQLSSLHKESCISNVVMLFFVYGPTTTI